MFCGASLTVAETYCCSECVAELMPEPDCRMYGGGDEKGQAKM
ncbi:protein NinF [Duffyella gerundensis]